MSFRYQTMNITQRHIDSIIELNKRHLLKQYMSKLVNKTGGKTYFELTYIAFS